MRTLALLVLVACGGHGEEPVDAQPAVDAACVADAAADQTAIRSAMITCGCCSEGDQICVDVTIAATGIGASVTAMSADPNPPSAPLLACIQQTLADECLAASAGQTLEVCQLGF